VRRRFLCPESAHTDRGPREQDLGNTNYCVFVPRDEFNRKTNAELVAAGLRRLDVDAYVNERNDICVDGFKMSLSPPSLSPSSTRLIEKRDCTSRDLRSSW
jgi:hypothetical protein